MKTLVIFTYLMCSIIMIVADQMIDSRTLKVGANPQIQTHDDWDFEVSAKQIGVINDIDEEFTSSVLYITS